LIFLRLPIKITLNEGLTSFIFAGGRATRLYPHTQRPDLQKPLLPMGSSDRKLIDFALDTSTPIASQTYVFTSYEPVKSRAVEQYLGQQPKLQVLADKRETGVGSIIDHSQALLQTDIDGDIAILCADYVIEGLSIAEFLQFHRRMNRDITVLAVPNKSYGSYLRHTQGLVDQFMQTPSSETLSAAGTYLVKARFLQDWVQKQLETGWDGEMVGFHRDLVVPAVIQKQLAVFPFLDGYWDDTGTPERYHANNMRLSKGENVVSKSALINERTQLQSSIVLGNVAIDTDEKLENCIISGDNNSCTITKVA
jgi:ADP-glucose pyrophosphorylase